MKLSETENVESLELSIQPSILSDCLGLWSNGHGIVFDQQTAAEFLPILQHFIETGELPE